MKKLMSFLTVILIFGGIGILIYPNVESHFQDKKMETMMSEFERSLLSLADHHGEDQTVVQELETGEVISFNIEEDYIIYEKNNPSSNEIEVVEEKPRTYTREEHNEIVNTYWPVEGMLSIESIDLLVPVIEGASLEHLDVSVSSLDGSPKAWESGNYAIAGHRSRKYGKHFNRLAELSVGDEIIFTDKFGNRQIYEVYESYIVHESDASVLVSHDYDEITLITCDPIYEEHPENRLIVQAKKIK